MSIIYNCHTGQPSSIITQLKQSIAQYSNSHTHFKIGITNNPKVRWASHSSDDWEKMVVIYETTSIKNAREIETLLIDHTIDDDGSWNEVSGGGGSVGTGNYYVYFLLSK